MTKMQFHKAVSWNFSFQGTREYQEDWYYSDVEKGIHIVCDGIGGGVGGEKASKGIIENLKEKSSELQKVRTVEELKSIIIEVYQEWKSSINEDMSGKMMGTTLVILLLNKNSGFVAHVGDSKAFYFKDNHLHWVTKDHSVVQELFDAGIIKDREEMQHHPMKNRITNALMAGYNANPPKIDVRKLDNLHVGDFFILCSDGAIEKYTSDDLENLFSNNDLQEGWNSFRKTAKRSSDNSTAILVMI